jgi:RNase adapter protein RapZ
VPQMTHPLIIFLTGMSGAGRSTAIKVFEDLGYATIDNLPHFLMESLLQAITQQRIEMPLVVGFDIRSFELDVTKLEKIISDFRQKYAVRLLFLNCQDEVLLRRYSATRHRHPLSNVSLLEGIAKERQLLQGLINQADHVIDTTAISVVTLGRVLQNIFGRQSSAQLQIRFLSFSYRRGLPPDADIVFDARFLKNPHYEEQLQKLTGKDPEVARFIERDKAWHAFAAPFKELLIATLQEFKQSGRSYLTIAIGCTGGQHRSVFIAEHLATFVREQGESVVVEHRELNRF